MDSITLFKRHADLEQSDTREVFGWRYSPQFDPLYDDKELDPEDFSSRSEEEPHAWLGTAHLDNFKSDSITYWRDCLSLARKLLRIFCLSLSLPEDYFDSITTFPGADGVYNFYPALTPEQLDDLSANQQTQDVGLGSHTDFQYFTLLWQDKHGGLQVLNPSGEWVWVTPVEGTFVINIGDFLRRLTNDRFKSSVHRAYNRGLTNGDRISMPFFFGKRSP